MYGVGGAGRLLIPPNTRARNNALGSISLCLGVSKQGAARKLSTSRMRLNWMGKCVMDVNKLRTDELYDM